MEPFAEEAEFWSRLMVSGMECLNIQGIMLRLFLVAFSKISMKGKCIIQEW